MNSITQNTLFDYMEIEELGDLQRLFLCFNGIDASILINTLNTKRNKGRNDFPNEVMLKLFLTMKVFGHNTVESFRRELMRNSQLRKCCGLKDYDTVLMNKTLEQIIPKPRVFTGFIKRLIKH